MLQILGWLMCGYLVVKAFELFGHARNGAENARTLYYVGGGLSLLLAPIFLIMLNGQASGPQMPNFGASSGSEPDYMDANIAAEAAADTNAALAATEDLGAAADNALRAADESLRAAEQANPR